jgi:type IV secretory pathway TrbF-like protein
VDAVDVMAVLRAVAAMAIGSKRHQAELGVALHRAGLSLSHAMQSAAVDDLRRAELVEYVIPLNDGGVLLSVTSVGMQRAGR